VLDTDTVTHDNADYLNDPIKRFNASTDAERGNLTRRQWRDTVINAYIQVADARYADFKTALNQETVGLNLGVDLVALGLTAAGAVAGTGAAHALSAASAGVIGAGAAFNKDAYYQKTLPALYAAMDTARKQVLFQIRKSQQSNEVTYTLGAALADVKAYEDAGTIEAAVAQLTSVANQALADADQQLHALFVGQIVDDTTQARKVKINRYVRGLAASNAKTTLDRIANALNVASDPDITAERNNILLEMDKRVVDKQSMDALSTLLRPITNQDF
jgi:hypothetical protein